MEISSDDYKLSRALNVFSAHGYEIYAESIYEIYGLETDKSCVVETTGIPRFKIKYRDDIEGSFKKAKFSSRLVEIFNHNIDYIEDGHKKKKKEKMAPMETIRIDTRMANGNIKRSFDIPPAIPLHDIEINKEDLPESCATFDNLIMECDNLLDIETSITDTYDGWKKKKSNIDEIITHDAKDKMNGIKYFVMKNFHVISKVLICSSVFFISVTFGVLLGLDLAALGVSCGIISGVLSILFRVRNNFKPTTIEEKITKGNPVFKNKSDDELMLMFLKEAYVGTIQKLNTRLKIIQEKVQSQRSVHMSKKEQILTVKDLFTNADDAINKIDDAINSLDKCYENITAKKADINSALNEYIGDNGYIAQKEKELERIKLAQKLTTEMEAEFNETLNMVKSVNVLTETIIPGIKKLMSYKIPELVDRVNYETDKEMIFLNEKESLVNGKNI